MNCIKLKNNENYNIEYELYNKQLWFQKHDYELFHDQFKMFLFIKNQKITF